VTVVGLICLMISCQKVESGSNLQYRDGSSEPKKAFSLFSFIQKKQNRVISGSEKSDSTCFKLIAHRGGITSDIYNEFDPASVLAAIEKGYYMLEADIRETRDGQLIVHHDNDFQRFFNHPGKVSELTWEEIQTLRSEKGDYTPMSFEQLAAMCSGKIQLMIDVKERTPEVFEKAGAIMGKYDLLEGAYFIQPEAIEHFWGQAKFSFRASQLQKIKERMDSGEDISQNFFLFDNGNLLYSEIIKWCQHNSITVVPSVNIGHYKFENHLDGARRDIEFLKNCGVTEFQIDSHYDKWLTNEY